jgi:hypothetical protein
MATTYAVLTALLAEARVLSNQTQTQDAGRVALWRIAVDRALEGHPTDATERWDHPERVAQRRRVKEMFRGPRL